MHRLAVAPPEPAARIAAAAPSRSADDYLYYVNQNVRGELSLLLLVLRLVEADAVRAAARAAAP
jgi:hypothetical protein